MINTDLLRVSLRVGAIYIPDTVVPTDEISHSTLMMVKQLSSVGYSVDEPLLRVLNTLTTNDKVTIIKEFNDVLGLNLNWAPLVKDWQTPTGQTYSDLLITGLLNQLYDDINTADVEGTVLPCGHLIPHLLFDIGRYNGCPLCGKPFVIDTNTFSGQGSKLRRLSLWRDNDVNRHLQDLLNSPVPLDASQVANLKSLLQYRDLPDNQNVQIKETLMIVIDTLIELGKDRQVITMFKSPVDILRFLWYKKTGQAIIVRPATWLKRAERAGTHHNAPLDRKQAFIQKEKEKLRLHYSRSMCRMVASWLVSLPMSIEAMCEAMHPHREMWVRFIRALRLGEMSRRAGNERLKELLERFYHRDYNVWAGQVETAFHNNDKASALQLLSLRPGIMARRLFSTMLIFGADDTLKAFTDIAPQLAPRLLLTLGQYANYYFERGVKRVVRPPLSTPATLQANPLLTLYTEPQLDAMADAVKQVFLNVTKEHFAATPTTAKTIYIEPALYDIPLSVGDRSTTIQDLSAALQGQRFKPEGDTVRLFLQWGKGLPAQHLDMDLSARIIYDNRCEDCSYYSLTVTGAQHSGDIREIPDLVGTAEYVELDLPELRNNNARYVIFTCNAYSVGMLNPNLVVGWMSARFPMKVSEKTGVAYDPSTVQHMVRVTEACDRGLVFGVLTVDSGEITWLELPFGGQNALTLNNESVTAYLKKLRAKVSIGELLKIKAVSQGLDITPSPTGADEVYTIAWALDNARVASTLL